jgi:hypothetical protein
MNIKMNEEPIVPVKAVMGLLKENTNQRNEALAQNGYDKRKIQTLTKSHIETLSRLVKYEGMSIIEEVFDYALKNGIFINCSSKIVEVKTKIVFTTKANVKKAHYTIYNTFLESVNEKNGSEPKYYVGNFLISQFADKFKSLLHNSVKEGHTYKNIEDYFNL